MSRLPATLERALMDACERSRAPGAVLGLMHQGRRTIVSAGYADPGADRPMTPQTLFRLGSVSKVLTALVAMRGVEAGVLDLDAPLQQRWPDFALATPEASAAVTLGQLLSHTSGLFGDFLDSCGEDDDALARYAQKALEFDLTSPPGVAFSYANAGFSLAARACEIAFWEGPPSLAKGTWETLLDAEVFRPLGMSRTRAQWRALPGDRARGHEFDASGRAVRVPEGEANRALAPAGQAIWTDAEDMLSLGDAILRAPQERSCAGLPEPDTLRAMMRPLAISPVPSFARAWGLGFALFSHGGPEHFGHDGAVGGQFAFWRLFPNLGMVMCLFVNGGDARAVCADVAEAIGKVLGVDLGVERFANPPAQQVADAERYAGRYAVSRYAVDITQDEGGLKARFGAVSDPSSDIEPGGEVTLRPAQGAQNGLFLSLWPHMRLPTHQAFCGAPGAPLLGAAEAIVFRGRRLPRWTAEERRG